MQPWDRDDWIAPSPTSVSAALEPIRRAALKSSLGHYPAVFAILDCVEFGLPQSLEGGIRSEMTSFVHLVLRPEPRAMIQTMFLGRVDYERLERKGQLPDLVEKTVGRRARGAGAKPQACQRVGGCGLHRLGRRGAGARPMSARLLDRWRRSPRRERARGVLAGISDAIAPLAEGRSDEDLRIADYAAVRQAGYPAYLGGPYAFAAARRT